MRRARHSTVVGFGFLLALMLCESLSLLASRAFAMSLEPQCVPSYQPATNVAPSANYQPVPASLRSVAFSPDQPQYHYSFYRSRKPVQLLITFRSAVSMPDVAPTDPIKVEANLSQGGANFVNSDLVPTTTIHNGILYVSLCIDPSRHSLAPGSYSGTVTVDDPRLPSAAAAFSVSLQYQHLPLMVMLYTVLLLVGCTTFVWLGTIRSRGTALTSEVVRHELPEFARLNAAGIAAGLVAASLVWKNQYLDAESWSGTLDDHLALLLVMVPAFIGPLASGVVFTKSRSRDPDASAKAIRVAEAGTDARAAKVEAARPRTPRAPQARRRIRVAFTVAVIAIVAAGAAEKLLTLRSSVDHVPASVQTNLTVLGRHGTSTTVPIAAGVPDVYDRSAADGLSSLRSAGFVAFAYQVCSHSVARDHVRQVIKPDGTILVDAPGTTEAGRSLSPGTTVQVKISTGVPCS